MSRVLPTNRVLIVPGLHSSGAGHWQTEWERRLPCSHRIALTDWSTPDLNAWIHAIETAIADFAPTHIVAHSFGTLASAVVAAQSKNSVPGNTGKIKNIEKLRGVFFVAPADPDKFDVRHRLPASNLPVRGVLFGSLSDPWLSWSGAQALGKQWGLQVECAGDVGHINVQSGHGEWHEGWQSLHDLIALSSTSALSSSVPAPSVPVMNIARHELPGVAALNVSSLPGASPYRPARPSAV